MKDEDEKVIKKALIKKAVGYDMEEVTEEYLEGEGEVKLVKRKVTKKNVPPDITAIKMLIETTNGISEMSDEQLEQEKQRLLNLLKEDALKEKNDKQ
jgi:hypothetical protein